MEVALPWLQREYWGFLRRWMIELLRSFHWYANSQEQVGWSKKWWILKLFQNYVCCYKLTVHHFWRTKLGKSLNHCLTSGRTLLAPFPFSRVLSSRYPASWFRILHVFLLPIHFLQLISLQLYMDHTNVMNPGNENANSSGSMFGTQENFAMWCTKLSCDYSSFFISNCIISKCLIKDTNST